MAIVTFIFLIQVFYIKSDFKIIEFKSHEYRAGHFAFDANGNMIIEYSKDNYRLFYGLKKDGNNFFGEETPTKEIQINNNDGDAKRYESRNIFVTNNNNGKQYLLSISSYISVTELHDLNGDQYKVKSTSEFLGNTIYSFVFSLLELDNSNQKEYLIVYVYDKKYIIQKFSFSDFDLSLSITNENRQQYTVTFEIRLVWSCIIDNLIAIFYVNKEKIYDINIYNFDLEWLNENNQIILDKCDFDDSFGNFFKCYHLKERSIILIYFQSYYSNSLKLKIGNITQDYSFTNILTKELNEFNFKTNVTLNDFVKMNEERFIFVGLSSDSSQVISILLIDLYNNYKNMKIRSYELNLNNLYEVNTELSADAYNNLLVFTSTVVSPGSSNQFSIFMMFGYINETDETIDIDISEFFMDDYINSNKNIITKLIKNKNIIIENNIFGYEVKEQLKLVSIPEEILFYNKINDIEVLVNNNDTLNKDYSFKQNISKEKTNEYYSLDYQIIVQEKDYDNFNSMAIITDYPASDSSSYVDPSLYFRPKEFLGRTSTIKFKLCHKFCRTCYKFGISNDTQQCMSCLEDYQFDYFNEYPSNCIPEGYFNDKEEGKLEKCNETNSKFYFDEIRNKTICFKNTYPCPTNYSFYNSSTRECQNHWDQENEEEKEEEKKEEKEEEKGEEKEEEKGEEQKEEKEEDSSEEEEEEEEIKEEACTYEKLVKNECSFLNLSNTEIYNKIKKEIIQNYPSDGVSIVIQGEDTYIFQLTNEGNEIDSLNGDYDKEYNLSIIDLAECEKLLKQKNKIDEKTKLIIFKFEKLSSKASEKNIQYEIYDPITKGQLDLSVCESTSINLYIPITLSEKTQNLYNDLSEQGYDIFNENDSFYQDICSTYKSENDTDVLLSDRRNDFYNPNETTCQANCHYSSYLSDGQYLKCECGVINKDINTEEPEKFTGKVIFTSFYNVLKYSNFGVLKCYKLVFDLQLLINNYGSIIMLIYFLLYLICLLTFIFKGISPIKIDIAKLLFRIHSNGQNCDKPLNNSIIIHKKDKMINNMNKNIFGKHKRRKSHQIELKHNKIESAKSFNKKFKKYSSQKFVYNNHRHKDIKKTNNIKIINLSAPPKNNKHEHKNYDKESEVRNLYLRKRDKNKIKKNFKSNLDNISIKIHKAHLLNSKRRIVNITKNDTSNFFKKLKIKQSKNKLEKVEIMNKKEEEKLSDFELNDLEYMEAIELDKRKFGQIYWSKLKREHIILFTFFSWDDYNIIYVKIARFIFLLSTDMAMNVFFFSDDSMHKIYLNYGKYDFVQQIPQIIYSTAISQLLEVFLCFLSLTDKYFYQIKNLKNDKHRNDIIFLIFRCIKIKLIIFFVFTFILFAFYWYFISAFCAVYQNTQIIFIKDSISSFLTGLLYPFVLYMIPSLLRIFVLINGKKMRLNFIYKLSDIIPIF